MLRILLHHPRFLVIDKPPGLGMHLEEDADGLVVRARAVLNDPHLYPVHRLDKVTSGALLLARDAEANRQLSEAFRLRRVEKYYLALSARKPSKKQGLVVGDMARGRRGAWKLLHSRDNPAVTQFFSGSLEPGLRWFLLKPATGKTHQIRVALKSLGAPILGDELYGAQSDAEVDRVYLHAWALRFPFEGQTYEVMASQPPGFWFERESMRHVLQEHAPPWQHPWPALPGGLKGEDPQAPALNSI